MYAGDALVYIGMSATPPQRISQHRATKEWLEAVDRVAISWFDDRHLAAAAEKLAIQTESPLQNLVKYGGAKKSAAIKRQRFSKRKIDVRLYPVETTRLFNEIGHSKIKADLNVKDRVINEHALRGLIPALWFAYCEEAVGRELPRHLFSFKQDLTGEFA